MRIYDEVKIVEVPGDSGEAEATLDAIALEGWRLVAVDAGRAYFRRRQQAVSITAEKLCAILAFDEEKCGAVSERKAG